MKKPRVFVGSSAERLDIAEAIQAILEPDAEVTVWNQGVFQLSHNSLQSLLNALDEIDFGVFVLAPDDTLKRGQAKKADVRDNVVYEAGLFTGKLGLDRVFFVGPRPKGLVADLHGITLAEFDERDNLQAALGSACRQILQAMNRVGPRSRQRYKGMARARNVGRRLAQRQAACTELDRLCDEFPIDSHGRRLTRDELHERR